MNQLPTIRITTIEGGHASSCAVLVTCSRCPKVRVIRETRQAADRYATSHLAGHGLLMAAATGDLDDEELGEELAA